MSKQITLLGVTADEIYKGIYKLREPVTARLLDMDNDLYEHGLHFHIVSIKKEKKETALRSIHQAEYLLSSLIDTSEYWDYYEQNIEKNKKYHILWLYPASNERYYPVE